MARELCGNGRWDINSFQNAVCSPGLAVNSFNHREPKYGMQATVVSDDILGGWIVLQNISSIMTTYERI